MGYRQISASRERGDMSRVLDRFSCAAGKPNAAVRDCQACHQVTAWNNIKAIGWYQSH